MSYAVFLSKEAVKTLEGVDRVTESRLSKGLDNLRFDPTRQGKLLKGLEGLRAIRVGDWRIVYSVKEDSPSVYILAIRPRGQAYRNL